MYTSAAAVGSVFTVLAASPSATTEFFHVTLYSGWALPKASSMSLSHSESSEGPHTVRFADCVSDGFEPSAALESPPLAPQAAIGTIMATAAARPTAFFHSIFIDLFLSVQCNTVHFLGITFGESP